MPDPVQPHQMQAQMYRHQRPANRGSGLVNYDSSVGLPGNLSKAFVAAAGHLNPHPMQEQTFRHIRT